MTASVPSVPASHLPGENLDTAKMPGHWLLARLGKRVLRPGGVELTKVMLEHLAIAPPDHVVELAPGLGATTRLALAGGPQRYTAVERDEDAAAVVTGVLSGPGREVRVGTAIDTGLAAETASVVFGEAFLTMQSDDHKRQMVAEAYRVLRPGGRYGLHELCITPDDAEARILDEIRGDLSRSIHVGARPLTVAAWRSILEDAGFEVIHQSTNPMALLEPRRVVADEGLVNALKILGRVLRDSQARARVRGMRAIFRRHADHLAAVTLVARKPDAIPRG